MASTKSDKLWQEAVRKTVLEYHEIEDDQGKRQKVRNLSLIAKTLVAKAREGDIAAINEIGNRLDGKAHQTSEHTERHIFEEIKRSVVNEHIEEHSGHTNGSGVPTTH